METKVKQIQELIQNKITGVWEVAHDGNGHRYKNTLTGTFQRSVTTKLSVLSKPHLTKWAVKMGIEWLVKEDRLERLRNEHFYDEMLTGAQLAHTDIRDDAGAVGTIAHNMAEAYILEWIRTGIQPKNIMFWAPHQCDPRSIASARAVEAFFHKHEIFPIASELLVGDTRYSAGTLDFLAIMDGKLTLIDFKTSNAVDQISYSAQVAAYKNFFEKMTELKIAQCKILHLSKDYDKFEVWKVQSLPQAWKAFKQICGVYDWMYGVHDKIIRDIKRLTI